MKLETIIGLEFHVELKTTSKMFCRCSNETNPKNPNENVCPICMGHPGTLPIVNREAINKAIAIALALNCEINLRNKFDRKNYFYPDLPKGYQISQYDLPIAEHGWFLINKTEGLTGSLTDEGKMKRVGIIRVHMEEDTAKLTHAAINKEGAKRSISSADFNRAGVPLVEIVTEPSFSTPFEAKTFAQELQQLLRYLNASDADMEKGHLRCDANISLRPEGDNNFYTKVEIKNLNSFRAIEKALTAEESRLTILWHDNKYPQTKETRGWDDKKQETILQRTKEDVADYRFFPEPDIPPLQLNNEEITAIKNERPELPQEKRLRFVDEYGISFDKAALLIAEKNLSDYFEQSMSELIEWIDSADNENDKAKDKIAKTWMLWFIDFYLPKLTTEKVVNKDFIISAENFAEFIKLRLAGKMNTQVAKKVFEIMLMNGQDPSQILEENDFRTADANELDHIVKQVIKNNPREVVAYKQGKVALLQFFVGQAMKETNGQADPNEMKSLFENFLK
jgi:aspartyl-tRNA(Asn)/glutamyl-tRNA(Gln) amidotransferase subunit B